VRLYSDVRKQTIIRQQPDDFFLVLGVHPEIRYHCNIAIRLQCTLQQCILLQLIKPHFGSEVKKETMAQYLNIDVVIETQKRNFL
jgi:hypothetical protein